LKRLGESYLEHDSNKLLSKSIRGDNSPPSATSNNRILKAIMLFLAGAGAGITSTATTYPFDIMRTQFTLQGRNQMFPTIRSYIQNTYKTKGIKGASLRIFASLHSNFFDTS
jgi:hypothetical protein